MKKKKAHVQEKNVLLFLAGGNINKRIKRKSVWIHTCCHTHSLKREPEHAHHAPSSFLPLFPVINTRLTGGEEWKSGERDEERREKEKRS